MNTLFENWRNFTINQSDDDSIINEAKELCRTYKNGLLIPKGTQERAFLNKLQELLALYEQGEISRRGFVKGMAAGAGLGLAGSSAAAAAKISKQSGRGAGTLAIGKGAQILAKAFDAITMGVENFVTQCYVDFIGRRKKPIDVGDLDDSLQLCLQIIAEDFRLSRKKSRGQWGDDSDYARVANSKLYIEKFGKASPGTYNMAKNMEGTWSIADSLTSTDPLNNIFNTLTHVNINLGPDTVQFRDIYDFNPAVNILGSERLKKGQGFTEDPNFFKSEENFYEFLKGAMKGNLKVYRGRKKGWVEVGFFSRAGIENLSRFYIGLFNYPGYGVNIMIPVLRPETKLRPPTSKT
jgi:hypothetical protein|tara:strand:+ start:866 stop:1918 length:1053 start_codon:yes stop_codon:yes gene_type:complete